MPVGAPATCRRSRNGPPMRRGLTTLPDWRIACNFVGKGHRARASRRGARRGARSDPLLGGGKVEAIRGGFGSCRLPLQRRPSTYEKLGFVRDRRSESTAGLSPSCRANVVGHPATLRGHSGTLAHPRVASLARMPGPEAAKPSSRTLEPDNCSVLTLRTPPARRAARAASGQS